MASNRTQPLPLLLLATVVGACSFTACGGTEEEDAASEESELVGFSTKCRDVSDVPGMKVERVDADDGKVHLRTGIMDPRTEPRADILFLHGFADRFDNHLPLFEGFRRAGFRVVAFDYPSHGETCGRGLDRHKIDGIAKLASFVESRTRPAQPRPLLLAGWSTGGLVSVRMLQDPSIALGRSVAGAFLLAPGVDVRTFVGQWQMVTMETLTSHPAPPHRGPISPRSPLQTPLFSVDLIANAARSREEAYPRSVPTFVVTGGEKEDVYADTKGVVAWVEARQLEGAQVSGSSCRGGRHELDNEAEPMGDEVRRSAVAFATWVVAGAPGRGPPEGPGVACARY